MTEGMRHIDLTLEPATNLTYGQGRTWKSVARAALDLAQHLEESLGYEPDEAWDQAAAARALPPVLGWPGWEQPQPAQARKTMAMMTWEAPQDEEDDR